MKPVALVLTAPGTNRDRDVAAALQLAGATPEILSMQALRADPAKLRTAQLAVLAGGFSYADALGSGAVWASEVVAFLSDELRGFVSAGKPVLGVCNGFQTLVRAKLLPGSLAHNQGGAFVCRWVTLAPTSRFCIWTHGIEAPFDCPVAHGEGRYVADPTTIEAHGALTYIDATNPNGSAADVAGATDTTGLVLGLMPHPENHVHARQHPRHHRRSNHRGVPTSPGLGLALFRSGVGHVVGS